MTIKCPFPTLTLYLFENKPSNATGPRPDFQMFSMSASLHLPDRLQVLQDCKRVCSRQVFPTEILMRSNPCPSPVIRLPTGQLVAPLQPSPQSLFTRLTKRKSSKSRYKITFSRTRALL